MMHERLVMMPCKCQIWKESNLALKEITEIDRTTEYISLKIKCLYCHKIKRFTIGIVRYIELFRVHEKEV